MMYDREKSDPAIVAVKSTNPRPPVGPKYTTAPNQRPRTEHVREHDQVKNQTKRRHRECHG
jgi:hypothetical protein